MREDRSCARLRDSYRRRPLIAGDRPARPASFPLAFVPRRASSRRAHPARSSCGAAAR